MSNRISRRHALASLGALGAVGATATFPYATSANSSSDPQRANVFALIGDRYHPADYLYNSLKTTLVDELGFSVDFRIDPRDLDPATLPEYKLLLMLHDGKVWPDGYRMRCRALKKERLG